jgi:hypothetical protein
MVELFWILGLVNQPVNSTVAVDVTAYLHPSQKMQREESIWVR